MKNLFLLTLLIIVIVPKTNASLLISPTRLNFENRDRVKEVILINSGNAERSYRVSWNELRALPQGGYAPIDGEISDVSALSPFIRFSPRQFVLKPGERQKIKLQLRRQASMPEEEYRSHLTFSALPLEDKNNNNENTVEGVQLIAKVMVNYTIPVLFHPSEGDVNIDIIEHQFIQREDDGIDLSLTLQREGSISAFGRIELYVMADGNEKQVGIANNVHVYKELDSAVVKVRVPKKEAINGVESIRVVYHGEKEHFGKTFVNETVSSLFIATNNN